MFTLTSVVHVDGLVGQQIFDFFMHPTDEAYQRWWPGMHLAFHELHGGRGDIGRRLLMDEYVGRRRVRLVAVVVEAAPARQIVWQLEKWVRLPIHVCFNLVDDPQGLTVTHTIRVGYEGWAALFDGVLRLVFDRGFEHDMDEHVQTEFPRLRSLLSSPWPT